MKPDTKHTNLLNRANLALFFQCDEYTINRYEEEAKRNNLSFKRGRGKYDFILAMKFILWKFNQTKQNKTVVSKNEIADMFGYSDKYINELEIRHGLPKMDFNKYDLREVVKWYVNHIRKSVKNKDLEIEIIRLKKAQAEKFEIENAKEKGELMPKAALLQILGNTFSNIRSRLTGLPNRIANQVYGSKDLIEAKIKTKEIIWETLKELSNPDVLFKLRIQKKKSKKNNE